MLFTQDANEWLNQIDPWCLREALDLLEAAQTGGAVGVFDCASNIDGTRWFVMAPHADNVLLLPSVDAWRAFMVEVIDRYGLRRPHSEAPPSAWLLATPMGETDGVADRRAANESRLMQLLDQAAVQR